MPEIEVTPKHKVTFPAGATIGGEPELGTRITKLAFKQRMTQAERVAIRNAAKENDLVYDFQDLLDSATFVDLKRQDTIDGVNQLAQAGLLTEARAEEILTAPVSQDEVYRG